MQVVAGLTIIQGLVAGVTGAATHHRFHVVSIPLSKVMGTSIFIAALTGGASARWVPNDILLLIFSIMALAASIIMLMQHKEWARLTCTVGMTEYLTHRYIRGDNNGI